ncbi:interferon kappa [Microcebus murinus]
MVDNSQICRFFQYLYAELLIILEKKKKSRPKPDMIQKCLWRALLVGLCITGILCLNCNLLNVHLRRVTWQNLRLLSSMSNSFPEECLRENKAFELPQEILSHTQSLQGDLKEAFYEMSIQAFNIFSRYIFESTWKQKHLKEIQIRLHQQAEYLKQCLEEEENENEDIKEDEMKHPGARVPQVNILELWRYFNRIVNFLKEKKYSHCAWEIVQVEMRRCLYFLHKFTALLRRK